MSGAASKRKGQEFERAFARSMGGRRTPLSGAVGGGDITPEPDSIWNGWSWENKRRAKLPQLLVSALAQAESDIGIGDSRKPAAAMREDHGRTIVAFYWEDLRPWCEALAETGQGYRLRRLARQLRDVARELEETR